MLADSEKLLGSPFRLRRKTLLNDSSRIGFLGPATLPIYRASMEDLREVEKWVGHIGQQLDGIIAKRASAPYRPGDDHSTVKIKNYRSADCVVGGFRDHVIGSARNELLLGLYDQKGTFNTLVPSASTQSKSSRLVYSDRRTRRLSTVGNRESESYNPRAKWPPRLSRPQIHFFRSQLLPTRL